jgi:lipoprotein NlpD
MMGACSKRLIAVFLQAWLPAVLAVSLLASCSSTGERWDPTDYTVKSGDTIYTIAWRYELDPEQLADWNDLSTGSRVRAGQRIHTREPSDYAERGISDRNVAYAPDIPAGSRWVKAQRGDTLYSISRRSGVSVQQLANLNQLDTPYTIHPGDTIFLKPLSSRQPPEKQAGTTEKTTKPSTAVKTTSTQPVARTRWPGTIKWQKPVQGRIVKQYNSRRADAKGIDIAGQLGSPVHAAAPGEVVYSGDGLISYGNLVIIKHNRQFLSAYAYNRKLLVKEGDRVKAGQRIATLGDKDKLGPRLHFEIRKNGKPVNPLKYIPW